MHQRKTKNERLELDLNNNSTVKKIKLRRCNWLQFVFVGRFKKLNKENHSLLYLSSKNFTCNLFLWSSCGIIIPTLLSAHFAKIKQPQFIFSGIIQYNSFDIITNDLMVLSHY